MLELKIKRLSETATLPKKAHPTDACFDIYADALSFRSDGEITIAPHETVKIPTGFATNIPHGYWGAVFARSGLATKEGLRPANCVGVCDSDYRGEYIVALHNDSEEIRYVEPGERIAQIVLMPYVQMSFVEVDELTETERGNGGFGSTGLK